MSMVGTFDGFTSARLGIYAAQHGLRVTGNNISNINTEGYTRQRVDQYSFKTGANDRYRSFYDNHIGSGALVKSISQIRDPYLDIRYRNISNDTYHYDTWLAGLQNIASILDEVGKGVGDNEGDGMLYRQLQDLAKKLRAYSADPTDLNDRLVRNSATSLTALFHSAADRLEKLYNDTQKEFTENISAVNEILLNIRDLNKSIREAEIHGDTALEMRDERNRQIDELSKYMDIKVEYSYENIGAGRQVEKLTISLNNANPDDKVHTDESILVDGLFATQLSIPEKRPVLNTFGNDEKYAYMNQYSYLRDADADPNATKKFLEAHGITMNDLPELDRLDENGNVIGTYRVIGTNDSDLEGVVMEDNDNYTIQLGQLVNEKDELWKNTTTRWEEITDLEPTTYKTWSYEVTSTLTDALGQNTFKIGEQSYYIVDGDYDATKVPDGAIIVKLSDVNTDEKFAKFVAGKLQESDKYKDDYIVTTNGKNIVFREKFSGKGTDPGLTVTPPGQGVDLGTVVEGTVKGTTPAGIDVSEYPQYKYDEHGNVIQTIDYIQSGSKWYKLQIDTEYTHEIALDDNDLHGILQAEREMLTEEGEFASEKDLSIDENALIKRGIRYYQQSLDLLAQKFAEAYNKLNSGYAYNQNGNYIREDGTELTIADIFEFEKDADGNLVLDGNNNPIPVSKPVSIDGLTAGQRQNLINNGYYLQDKDGNPVDKNGNPIKDANGNIITKDDVINNPDEGIVVDLDSWLANEENGAYFMGGVLFSNRGDGNDPTGITAANIAIAADWSNGVYGLIPTFMMLFTESGGLTHSTQNDNADHMVAMIENPLVYNPRDLYGSDAIGPVLFDGCFNDMFSNMMAVQGEDADMTNLRLTDYAISLTDLEYSREGVSGVDLNDEAMNMVSYQKAMSAAMRLMTAIDEMLDRLINNTGLAGR